MLRVGMLFFALISFASSASAAQTSQNQVAAGSSEGNAGAALYMKVQLKSPLKLKGLKTGDEIQGNLSQPVYSGAREVLPAGCPVRLTVDHFEKRKRERNDHWPWVVTAFTPRHESYPVFRSAKAALPDGKEVLLQVAFLTIATERQVDPKKTKTKAGSPPASLANSSAPAASPQESASSSSNIAPRVSATPIATFEATVSGGSENLEAATANAGVSAEHDTVTLEPGTQAKIILLDAVSASKSKPGDAIEARLIEPVKLGSVVVLPEGTLFQGKVLKATPPKMLSRPGSLLVTFDDLKLLTGVSGPVVASVSGADLDQKSHTQMNPEGVMSGGWPGKAWLFINIGVTAGLAKVSDDTLQLIIESIVSTATDASTAGVGRIAATCVSGIFLLTRHGRDVVLPKFTELRITLNRPLTVPGTPPQQGAGTPGR
jgi:hypothetical protein